MAMGRGRREQLTLSASGTPHDGTLDGLPQRPQLRQRCGRRVHGHRTTQRQRDAAAPVIELRLRAFTSAPIRLAGGGMGTSQRVCARAQRNAPSQHTTAGSSHCLDTATALVPRIQCQRNSTRIGGSNLTRCVSRTTTSQRDAATRCGTLRATGCWRDRRGTDCAAGIATAHSGASPGSRRERRLAPAPYSAHFVVESVLDATRIAAIARAVLADTPTGAKGEALTYSRTGVRFCDSVADGTAGAAGSILPANRPCVTRGGLLVEGTRTNLLPRWEELDNASWASVGTPTMSANSTVSPWGTLTADTLGDDDGAAFEGKTQTVATTATNPSVLSCYAKAGTGTKLRLSNDATTCDSTVTADWVRYSCPDASASGASTAQAVLVGNATTDTGNIVVTGCQFETGAGVTYATSGIPTTTAAGVRGVELGVRLRCLSPCAPRRHQSRQPCPRVVAPLARVSHGRVSPARRG